MSWIYDWLTPGNLVLVLAAVLTILKPWLVEHGIPAEVIDEILVILGNGSVAAVRLALPEKSRGYTYTATAGGVLVALAGLLGLLSPGPVLATGITAIALSGLSFRSAVYRMNLRLGHDPAH